MGTLPANRVTDVNLTKLDRFATARGFGTPMILTTDATGVVDATNRTKVYGSIEEVADDYADTTEPYKAAQAMFSQNPRPLQIKIGFIAAGVLTTPTPSPTIGAELNAVYAYDTDWYWLTMTAEFRDLAILDDVMDWVEARPVLFMMDSNDAATESPSDTTSVAARNKGRVTRSGIFYGKVAAEYPAAAAIARASRFNFDQRESAYTLKFKDLRGISRANISSAVDQAVTGFIPAIGLSAAAGHYANIYVDQGGLGMVKEGTMLDGGFVDELHFADWLISRVEESQISTLANQPGRIPYTNSGLQVLVSAVEAVMQRAAIAGAIGETTDPNTGELNPAYTITVERVEDVPESQRRQRIAPAIIVNFLYAGAVHFSTVRLFMSF